MAATQANNSGSDRRNFDAFLVKLAHHESQLESLDNRIGGMERTLASIAGDLKGLANVVVADQAKPTWDFNKMLQNVTYGSALLAAAVASIVYVSGNNFAVTMNAQGTRIEAVAERSELFHKDVQSSIDRLANDWKERQNNTRERLIGIEKFLLEQTAKGAVPGINPERQRFIPSPDDWSVRRDERVYKDERKL